MISIGRARRIMSTINAFQKMLTLNASPASPDRLYVAEDVVIGVCIL
jgi:hypothetical protein